jgi:hypothetical protein
MPIAQKRSHVATKPNLIARFLNPAFQNAQTHLGLPSLSMRLSGLLAGMASFP